MLPKKSYMSRLFYEIGAFFSIGLRNVILHAQKRVKAKLTSSILESMVEHLHPICTSTLVARIAMLALILLLLLTSIYEGRHVATLNSLMGRQELQALVFKLSVLLPAIRTRVKLWVKHVRPALLRICIRLALRVVLIHHRVIRRLLPSGTVGRSTLRPLRQVTSVGESCVFVGGELGV